jgi:DNA-binding PadR family transcriptional regulator
MFRYLVLGLLRSAGPLHGYALMKAYCERSGTRISTGSFYRELAKLVADGLISTAAPPPGADPRRAPYQISTRGAAAFDAWLSGPHRTPVGSQEDEVSVALLFLPLAGREVVEKLLRDLQEDLWMRSKILERAREAAVRRQPRADERGFDSLDLLLTRRQKHVAAEIEFLTDLRTAYGAWLARQRMPAPSSGAAASRPSVRRARTEVR